MTTRQVKLNHTEFQGQVVDLADQTGWNHLHVRRTIGRGGKWVTATNISGWPDLFLWHERRHLQITAEIKIPPDDLSPDQAKVIKSLRASGLPCYVWRPDDWDEIERVLIGERRRRR